MICMGLLGATGKMGTLVQQLLKTESNFKSKIKLVKEDADIWLDFSLPVAVLNWAQTQTENKDFILLVGSTGWTTEQRLELADKLKGKSTVFVPNFSQGIGALTMLLSKIKDEAYFKDSKVSIIDTHHTQKRDAPSGTALKLARVFSFDVPIASIREGDVIGKHEVIFETKSERIIITHEAKSRDLFAFGALNMVIHFFEKKESIPKRQLDISELAEISLTP